MPQWKVFASKGFTKLEETATDRHEAKARADELKGQGYNAYHQAFPLPTDRPNELEILLTETVRERAAQDVAEGSAWTAEDSYRQQEELMNELILGPRIRIDKTGVVTLEK
jgi:hypothetical protein